MDKLKEEQYNFDSQHMLNPYLNIAAGIYYISYLKDRYKLEDHQLYSSYHLGVNGSKNYASRQGTYETKYSKKVKEIKKELTKY